MAWSYHAAGDLIAALRAGEVTSVALTDEAIGRIEREDKAINAICVRDFERARTAAEEADRARARGEDRPLLGIPVTVKESFHVAGLPTTWGMPEFRDHLADVDTLAVARVKAAGAVILGKTNVPFMLQNFQSYNDIYGTTNNPWDLDRTPGGSSGGSAAALAAGFGALSLGSDIGGSLRNPAHFCGIYAHKPSFGLIPTRGYAPPPAPALPNGRDLAVLGPMARTAADLTLLLDVMAGPDPLTDGVAYRLTLPAARHERLADFRVLVLDEHPLVPTSAAVRAGVERVADALAAAGALVRRRSPLLPDLTDAGVLYCELLLATLGANFPADRYRSMGERAAQLSADDRSLDATRARGAVFSHRDWLAANSRREQHRQAWREFFAEFDAVLGPIGSTPALPHNHTAGIGAEYIDIDGVECPAGDQLVWAGLATMPGLPATAIPTGPSPEGLPVGVQLIGPMFADRTTLRLAELLEQEIGGFQPPR